MEKVASNSDKMCPNFLLPTRKCAKMTLDELGGRMNKKKKYILVIDINFTKKEVKN